MKRTPTPGFFRRWQATEEEMIRATMPRVAAIDPPTTSTQQRAAEYRTVYSA